jgi:hypothetical protein
MATRWGHHPPARHGPPLCARRPAGWPGGVVSGSGVCGRRFRSRAYGRRDPRGAPEGQQQGEGHTSVVAARAPGPTLRVVRPPRARRRRHGDLSGQGAGHIPCRVSRPVSRRHMAAGGAVDTAAASPTPRPGSSPAQARLLVLTPSSGHEGSRAQRPELWKKVRGRFWGFSPKPSHVAARGLLQLTRSDNGHYGAHDLALLNAVRTYCGVEKGALAKNGHVSACPAFG